MKRLRWVALAVALGLLVTSLASANPDLARNGIAEVPSAVVPVTQTIDPCHKRCSPLKGSEYKMCRNACDAEGKGGADFSDYNKRQAHCMIVCQGCKTENCLHGFWGCVKACTG